MPETFTPKTWADGPGGGTPITAAELNRVETGVESMDDRVAALEDNAAITGNTVTASYTLALADAGRVVAVNSASPATVTVPPSGSVAFPVGTVLEVLRYGTGTVTIAAGVGVTLRVPVGSPLTLRVQFSSVSLRQHATDEWVLAGDLG